MKISTVSVLSSSLANLLLIIFGCRQDEKPPVTRTGSKQELPPLSRAGSPTTAEKDILVSEVIIPQFRQLSVVADYAGEDQSVVERQFCLLLSFWKLAAWSRNTLFSMTLPLILLQ